MIMMHVRLAVRIAATEQKERLLSKAVREGDLVGVFGHCWCCEIIANVFDSAAKCVHHLSVSHQTVAWICSGLQEIE